MQRQHETTVSVRFNEIDSYNVAWHGHYVGWMEIGRTELAVGFGLDAATLSAAGYLAPVVNLELKYLRPARFRENLTIRTTLRKPQTAMLEFHSTIIGEDGSVCARGKTVHVLTDLNGTLQYRLPAGVEERVNALIAWGEGK